MKVNIKKIDLSYRDDIIFRYYVLKTNNKQAWKDFVKLTANKKVSKSSIYRMHKNIKKIGQKVPIPVYKRKGVYYPLGGATRLAALLALGKTKVKIHHRSKKINKWNDRQNIDTKHFKGMDEMTIMNFKNFLNQFHNRLSLDNYVDIYTNQT